jgi:putative sigma-54 modulation protein
MKYIIRGDKILVTESIKKYIKEKLDKLDKYFEKSNEIEATVLIKVKGFNQKIEVTIPTNNFIIRNEETSEDLYAAIDKVADKIERQIRKNKTKINQIERNCTKKMMLDFLSEEEEAKEDNKIVKRKKLDTKPMDEEEAILQMEMLCHDFFIYKDRNTGKVCVLYRRKDNNYGIIETE